MLQDNLQIRHLFLQGKKTVGTLPREIHIHDQALIGDPAHIVDEITLRDILEIAAPKADPLKNRISGEMLQVARKIFVTRLQPPHQPDDKGVVLGDIQHPLVVFHPLAGLNDDDTVNPLRHRLSLDLIRQSRAVEQFVIRIGPGHALGPKRVKDMNMCIDNHFITSHFEIRR